ncbi:DUF6220 domain-containing protein [Paenibacillus allorhizosphaerae]|uniref:DoxX family protein n=1 Tax=Paenibacillus allorhizosphaerae TaxID=2849866 RepID=A0ABN7TFW6_9BACL|nr:DUF6220 domain-containing protein [Paenibacillus allorhizosphaerae]CAG7626821.1 hypothetical protein PAECIP111802_01290 [Paenibacillus allorhizosphaerae]
MNQESPDRIHNAEANANERSRLIRATRFVYGLLAAIYLICVILQVFFAGMGLFVNSDNLQWHRTFANSFEFVPVVMFGLSFAGRIRGSLRWLPLGLFALTVLQHMTLQLFGGVFPALHTVNALLLFWISLYLTRRSGTWLLSRK